MNLNLMVLAYYNVGHERSSDSLSVGVLAGSEALPFKTTLVADEIAHRKTRSKYNAHL
jgi:hypothetical protein